MKISPCLHPDLCPEYYFRKEAGNVRAARGGGEVFEIYGERDMQMEQILLSSDASQPGRKEGILLKLALSSATRSVKNCNISFNLKPISKVWNMPCLRQKRIA